MEKNYIELNKTSWNNKVDVHIESEFYNVKDFKEGKSSLNSIELDLLGDIKGKSILHLQCHFGQDSISLSRLGAEVTAVDFSDKAIDAGVKLANETDENITFICCDIYNLPTLLDKKFDIVYTSYGTIGWLPDITKWASIVSRYLKPNGRFIFVEFHPVVWMFDDDFKYIKHSYFNTKAILETEEGTYASKENNLKSEFITWNHSLSEVLGSLLEHNLSIKSFKEYDYSPYDCFEDMVEFEPSKFKIKHLENKIPMVYSLEVINNLLPQ